MKTSTEAVIRGCAFAVLVLVGLVILVGVIGYNSSPPASSPVPAPPPQQPDSGRTTLQEPPAATPEPATGAETTDESNPDDSSKLPWFKEARFGCVDKDYFEKVLRLRDSGDNDAAFTQLTSGVIGGECATFKKGERVYLNIQGFSLSSLVQVRKPGETAEFWVDFAWAGSAVAVDFHSPPEAARLCFMKVYWWQAGLHLTPESKDENEALKSLEACLRSLGHYGEAPKLGKLPRRSKSELGVVAQVEPAPLVGVSDGRDG